MEYRQEKGLPWVVSLLIAALICGLSVLGAFLVKQGFGANAHGNYTAVTLSGNAGVQVSGEGFVYYNGSALAQRIFAGQDAMDVHDRRKRLV